MELRCENKVRNNSGQIVYYVIGDGTGRAFEYAPEDLKKMIKQRKIKVLNLQIDAAGRLVDKAEEKPVAQARPNLTKDNVYEDKLKQAFEDCYNHMIRDANYTIAFGQYDLQKIYGGPAGELTYMEPDEIVHALYVDKGFNDYCNKRFKTVIEKANAFENYIKNVHGCYPNKLAIKTKNDTFIVVSYGLSEIYLCPLYNYIDSIKAGTPQYEYFKSLKNYTYRGVCLDGSNRCHIDTYQERNGSTRVTSIGMLRQGNSFKQMIGEQEGENAGTSTGGKRASSKKAKEPEIMGSQDAFVSMFKQGGNKVKNNMSKNTAGKVVLKAAKKVWDFIYFFRPFN